MEKSLDLINARIRDGNARVVTADEMPAIVDELGEEGALEEVDVVTTGTFGAMCSSGAFFNFGHADPPIRMERIWLNDVEAYAGIAAVDAYLGATQEADPRTRSTAVPTSSKNSSQEAPWNSGRPPMGPTATRAGASPQNCCLRI